MPGDALPDKWDKFFAQLFNDGAYLLPVGEQQIIAKVDAIRMIHTFLRLWPVADDLSEESSRSHKLWVLRGDMLKRKLRGDSVQQIAEEMKCKKSVVSRHLREIQFTLSVADALLIEVESRLRVPLHQDILHRIRIGQDYKTIVRHAQQRGDSSAVVDRIYVHLRRTFLQVLEEFVPRLRKQDEGIRRLLQALREIQDAEGEAFEEL